MLFFSTAGAWSGGLGAVLGPGVVGRGWAQGWGNLPAPGPGQQLPSWVQGGWAGGWALASPPGPDLARWVLQSFYVLLPGLLP